MGDSSPDEATREPQNGTGLRWTDTRTPFTWRGWNFGADVLRFGGNENPYRPPTELLDAIAAAADRVNRYPFGMETSLVEGLSTHVGCLPEQVMIAPGTSALVEAVIKGLGGPDGEVVYPDSSYPAYRGAASAVRAQVRPVPLLPGGTCDIEGIADACTDRTSLVIVCNPNNPTGGMAPTTDLRPLIDALPARTLLMIDEAYWEFTDEYADGGRGALDYLECGKPVLVTRTFSKFYGLAGLRVGYGVASGQIASELHSRLRLGGANIVGLVAAEAALGLTDVFAERAERIKAERGRLFQAFSSLGFDPLPTQTNFIFCPHTDDDLPAKLMAAGYWVRDGRSVQMPGGMRVTVGNPDENDKLLAAIRAIVSDEFDNNGPAGR
jgi:histidinol-phosphate aminotransferase